MSKINRTATRSSTVDKTMRVGRPPKVLRQLSVTSNKIIDRALELMVLQGLAKTKEKAATLLLNSAANKFIKNNLKIVSSMSLDNMLDAHEIDENGEED